MVWLRESTNHREARVSAERPKPPTAQLFETPLAKAFERPWAAAHAKAAKGLLSALLALLLLAPPAQALNDAQQLVVEAWRLVNQSYVDPASFETVNWKRLRQKVLEQPINTSQEAYAAIDSMLAPLGDPYTRLLRPADYATLRSNTKGTVTGVGLQLGLQASDQTIVVIAPLDGSPAAEAGITSGTAVVAVNGKLTAELGLDQTAAVLRGEAGTRVLLRLDTNGKEKEIELQRRQVDLKPVRVSTRQAGGHTLGYLRITQFSEPVPEQTEQALSSLEVQGIDGLILDLRNNSGGLVSAGVAVANAFLDRQAVVETQDRQGLSSPVQAGPGQLYAGPMLTLVNGGTASASEILAGALQDNGRSPLAGGRTFGKGLIQTLINLGDTSGLAVTVARYLTPSGRDIQNQGIEPNTPLASPEPLNPGGRDDTWLDQAEALLLLQLDPTPAPEAA